MANEQDDHKERLRLYERTRDELVASTRSNSASYDRALLTLSSAFLGGSLAFVGQVVDFDSASLKCALYVAWALFVVTILITITSFIYGLLKFQPLLDAAERYYLQQNKEAWKTSLTVQRAVNRYIIASGISFILGAGLLTTFIARNIPRAIPMTQNSGSSEKLERSIPPGTFQKPATPTPAAPDGAAQTKPQSPATNVDAKKKGR